jgi:hypothetical protein
MENIMPITDLDLRALAPRIRPLFAQTHFLKLLRAESGIKGTYLIGVEAIGAGYNPFGKYATADSITIQLFDWNAAPTRDVLFKPGFIVPDAVDVQQADGSICRSISGQTINKYQKSLAATVSVSGGYNFFSGSLSTEFSDQTTRESTNEFSRVQQSISVWSLHLAPAPSLRQYLRPGFRDYLDNLPRTPDKAQELFDTYGSHFLTGIVMGGRAVCASATDKVKVDRSFSIDVTAKAAFEFLTGQISAQAKTTYQNSISSFQSVSETNSFITGGDAVKAARAFQGKDCFDAWCESVGSSPDFVDFVSNNPMSGIWMLCKEPAQSTFLQEYYLNHWAVEQSKRAQVFADYVDDVVIITGKNSTIQPPAGYEKVNFDLNKGAHGDFIYLCYHKASYDNFRPNKDCLTDIQIIFGKDTPAPPGFIKLPQDLNKGAGGPFIYMCVKKEPYGNDKAIKDVAIIGGDNPDIPAPYGYIKVPGDLNKGVGGLYIYACYNKDI